MWKLLAIIIVSFAIIGNYIRNWLEADSVVPSPTLSSLDPAILNWEKRGSYTSVFGFEVFGIHVVVPDSVTTICIIHGYPSSSFEYSYNALDTLVESGHSVIVHDHIGFGLSSKPEEGFGYSVHDHADVTLEHWRMLNITGDFIVIGHDMGDSILTEILSRYRRDKHTFPGGMNIKQVVFTNGGMHMKAANLRISQHLLSSKYGQAFNKLSGRFPVIAESQMRGVFATHIQSASATSPEGMLRDHQIKLIMSLNDYRGGTKLLWKTIRYLFDRYACEDRWMASLAELQHSIPMHIVWGADDSVAPRNMPQFVVMSAKLDHNVVPVLHERKGHFWMLEDGEGEFWARAMLDEIGPL